MAQCFFLQEFFTEYKVLRISAKLFLQDFSSQIFSMIHRKESDLLDSSSLTLLLQVSKILFLEQIKVFQSMRLDMWKAFDWLRLIRPLNSLRFTTLQLLATLFMIPTFQLISYEIFFSIYFNEKMLVYRFFSSRTACRNGLVHGLISSLAHMTPAQEYKYIHLC